MKVQLMLTCLCDAFYGEAGIATVQVLEHCGVEVVFPKDQTCCGQPAFNSGDWESARKLTARVWEIFDPKLPIIVPSASCAAMLRHGAGLISSAGCGAGSADDFQPFPAISSTPRQEVYELSEFLLDFLQISKWPNRGTANLTKKKIIFHQSCHGRMIGLGDRQKRLLQLVPNLEIFEPEFPEQCCGFGGMFAAKQPHLSESIGNQKLSTFRNLGDYEIVSGDLGCLMHLQTLAAAQNERIRVKHYAQILADAISPSLIRGTRMREGLGRE
jgi:L-lactate dehydrogenase complex protein LldE